MLKKRCYVTKNRKQALINFNVLKKVVIIYVGISLDMKSPKTVGNFPTFIAE